eukprot:TRINITY_DN2105_c0_g2_i1.p1 TRINITY_DN2105_c0_g2~~TRINITY_DN2105_c0_g2_i1.p1  ORF type:complete len:207 (-),score=35.31 TRINITY_DN2105_c0_g2_i1:709-1329(-)
MNLWGRTSIPEIAINEMGLFDDVALMFEEEMCMKWYIGRVLKMYRQTDTGGKIDYHLPVSMDSSNANIHLLCKYYKSVSSDGLKYSYGGYEGKESDPVKLNSVITTVGPLSYERDANVYNLPSECKRSLDDFIAEHNQLKDVNRGRGNRKATTVGTAPIPPPHRQRPPPSQSDAGVEHDDFNVLARQSVITSRGRKATCLRAADHG